VPSTPGEPRPDGEHQRRASSFGAVAGAYAEHRPDYAGAAVDWVLAPAGDRRPVQVIDIGAGTGRLTAVLARHGAAVTAVEPDPAMLAELRRILPEVPALTGRAYDDAAAWVAGLDRASDGLGSRTVTVRAYLGSQPETAAGEFTVPLVTAVLRAVRD
jgi:SAM-dependent methyltransferase